MAALFISDLSPLWILPVFCDVTADQSMSVVFSAAALHDLR